MPNGNQTTINKDGLSQDVLDYIEGLEGENNTLAEALDEATEELVKAASPSTNATDDADEVTKGLPAEVAEIVKGILAPIQAENATLKETIEGERDIRLTAEQISKAASYGFGDSTELGEVLKSVNANCGAEVYEKLTKSLDAAKGQLSESGLFTETGSTTDGPARGDVSKAASLMDAATELVSKGGAKSVSDALRVLARTTPALFESEGN